MLDGSEGNGNDPLNNHSNTDILYLRTIENCEVRSSIIQAVIQEVEIRTLDFQFPDFGFPTKN